MRGSRTRREVAPQSRISTQRGQARSCLPTVHKRVHRQRLSCDSCFPSPDRFGYRSADPHSDCHAPGKRKNRGLSRRAGSAAALVMIAREQAERNSWRYSADCGRHRGHQALASSPEFSSVSSSIGLTKSASRRFLGLDGAPSGLPAARQLPLVRYPTRLHRGGHAGYCDSVGSGNSLCRAAKFIPARIPQPIH